MTRTLGTPETPAPAVPGSLRADGWRPHPACLAPCSSGLASSSHVPQHRKPCLAGPGGSGHTLQLAGESPPLAGHGDGWPRPFSPLRGVLLDGAGRCGGWSPPLTLWLMAASFWLLGPTPFAARIWQIGLSLGALLLTVGIGRLYLPRRAAYGAGWILLIAFLFYYTGLVPPAGRGGLVGITSSGSRWLGAYSLGTSPTSS